MTNPNLPALKLPAFREIVTENRYEDVIQFQFTNYGSAWGGPEIAIARLIPTADYVLSIPDDHFIVMPLRGITDMERREGRNYEKSRAFTGRMVLNIQGSTAMFRWNKPFDNVYTRIFPQTVLAVAEALVKGDPASVHLINMPLFSDPLLEQLLLTLIREAKDDNPSGRMYVEIMGFALVTHLVRHYSTLNPRHVLAQKSFGLSHQQLEIVTSYIKAYFYDSISLEDLAALVGLSRYYFARMFKRSTGFSPHEYLTRERIEQAKRLLSLGVMNITEVAHFTGFADVSKFSTIFKSIVGVPPSAIIKESKKRKL